MLVPTCEGLIVFLHGLQVIEGLLIGGLQLVHLGHVGAALLLGGVQLQLELLTLLAPFCNHLIKGALLLVKSCSSCIRLREANRETTHLSRDSSKTAQFMRH